MQDPQQRLRRRAQAILFRIESLTNLRKLVTLASAIDVTPRQWAVIEPQLVASSARLASRVKRATENLLVRAGNSAEAARELTAVLGQIELDMARAFTFFDTYMDILTQRQSPTLGAVLAGCDVLALEAMRRDHPALAIIEPPLVYCERGIGAAIARESVPFPDGSTNPMPLIQIPYARLSEKYNLTSLLHEAGHQTLHRLQLTEPLAQRTMTSLRRARAPKNVVDLYGRWMFEIGPDFWAFGLTGVAEAAAVCELFAMPPSQALRIAVGDPHPPPYLRSLLCFDWCRRAWGRGLWNEWERQWLASYRLEESPPANAALLKQARRFIPVVGKTLFDARFDELNGRRLLDILDLDAVSPSNLERLASPTAARIDLQGRSPCAQLAAFRMLREWRRVSEERLDQLMSDWLVHLGATRRTVH